MSSAPNRLGLILLSSILLVLSARAAMADSLNDDVIPTTQWMNVYCHAPSLDGAPFTPGDTVKAFDPDGVYCGKYIVRPDGGFGFLAVYRDDSWTPDVDEGAKPGDRISFKINDTEVATTQEVYWTGFGDKIEVCEFSVETTPPITCDTLDLDPGWNLVSWNTDYSGSIDDFLSLFAEPEIVQFVYTFDGDALVYDPELPEYSTLDSVDYRHGYWIKASQSSQVLLCGFKPDENDFIPIESGWNIVSYWPESPLPVETAFSGVLGQIQVVRTFDGEGLDWAAGFDTFNSLNQMQPGSGYWLRSTGSGSLSYPGWGSSGESPLAIDRDPDDVIRSTEWSLVCGSRIMLDGCELENGSTIEFRTENAHICGRGTYTDGSLTLTPVYMNDGLTDETEALGSAGETLSIYVNGAPVLPNLELKPHGRKIIIGNLYPDPSHSPSMRPEEFVVHQNYPNPFNAATTIAFELPRAMIVHLSIYNILGQNIATLADSEYPAGANTLAWDGSLYDGTEAPSGIYFYRVRTDEFSATRKMLLVK